METITHVFVWAKHTGCVASQNDENKDNLVRDSKLASLMKMKGKQNQ